MSLFRGMKLASSGSDDKSVTDTCEPAETVLRKTITSDAGTHPTDSAERQKEIGLCDFSLRLTTSVAQDTRNAGRANDQDACGTSHVEILSDQEVSKTAIMKASGQSTGMAWSESAGLGNDLNFDLDPFKVTQEVNVDGHCPHHPMSFDDLHDLDFSSPHEHDVTRMARMDERDRDDALDEEKPESRFSFISKEPLLPSEKKRSPPGWKPIVGNDPPMIQEMNHRKPRQQSDEQTSNEPSSDGCAESVQRLIEIQLSCHQSEHTRKMISIQESISELEDRISQLASDCIASRHDLILNQTKLQSTQEQQQQAVIQEDYEKAEELHSCCRLLEGEIENVISPLPFDHPVLTDLLADLESVYDRETEERRSMAVKYHELIAEQRTAVEAVRGRCSLRESSLHHTVQDERIELDRDMGHLDLDKDHLSKREANLDARIDERTSHLRGSRDSLIVDRQQVQREIHDLEATLASLRLKESSISDSILKHEHEIEEVRREFTDEEGAVERERMELETKEYEMKRRQDRLDDERKKIDGEMEEDKKIEAREKKLLADLETLHSDEEQAITKLMEKKSNLLAKLKTESLPIVSDNKDNLLKKRDDMQQKIDEAQTATTALLQSQTRVVTLRQRVSDTEGHIASMSETKQLAVMGQNFSDAKRLTDEIKKLTSDGRRIQEEMEDLMRRNEDRSETVKKLRDETERLQEEVHNEERDIELTAKDKLLESMKELKERLEGHPSDLSAVIDALHQAQLTASILQVKFLCLKHCLPFPDELEDVMTSLS